MNPEMAEISWLLEESVRAIHSRQISEYGGNRGVRDEGLLISALARPQEIAASEVPLPDLATLAASLAYEIARNRPFVDGNKRVALVAARTFLLINGADFDAAQGEKYFTILRLAEGHLSEKGLADWIRPRMKRASREA